MKQGHSYDYVSYMRSAEWERRKDAYYAKHERQCRACGRRQGIELHHLTYVRLRKEPDADLMPLCRASCHLWAHRISQWFGVKLWTATWSVVMFRRLLR